VKSATPDATRVEGVPQVTAPTPFLARMLAIRVHLDAADESSGALVVAPRSHLAATDPPSGDLDGAATVLRASRGDVLLMRPLLVHRSGRSDAQHRRVLHDEIAPGPAPPPHEWYEAVRLSG
jgi:hypothetical protein